MGLFGCVLIALLGLPYLGGLVMARRRGVRRPAWRSVSFLLGLVVLGVSVAVGTNPAAHTRDWVWALSLSLTAMIAPFLLTVGDPVAVAEAALGHPVRGLRGRATAVLLFPPLASVLNAAALLLVFCSAAFDRGRAEPQWFMVTQLACLASGCYVNLPVLTDVLPAWCTPGWKMLFALVDGLLDEIPCIVVMTMARPVAGGTMLVVTQFVTLPMIVALMIDWVRHDRARTRQIDAELDARDAAASEDDATQPWWLASRGEPGAPKENV